MSTSLVSDLILACSGAAAGLAFGLLYFAGLRRNVNLVADYRRVAAAVLILGRLVCAITFFGGAAKLGALPLLSAFLGFLLARTLALRTVRSIA